MRKFKEDIHIEKEYGHFDESISSMADWRKRHAFLFKTLAFILIFAFILYDITWAQGGTPIWQYARPDIRLNGKVRLNGIKTPYEAGTAQDVFSNGSDEVVINIQDAHASLTAQKSIVKILQTLASNYDLNLIALEGAEGPVDISLLKTFPDPEIRKETAEYLMQKGKMSAGEFFSIVSEKPIKLYGVENNALYRANVEALNRMMRGKMECIESIEGLLNTLQALEPKVYSEDLMRLNRNTVLHKDGKFAFTEHWDFISKLAKRNNVEIVIFDNLSKLLKSIELEKNIDFQKANEERKLLIDELSKLLPKRELEKLVLESLSFKMGKISQADFHQYLVRLGEDIKLSPKPYSNLIGFTRYITVYEDIDLVGLFREVEEFEDYIREEIFRNDKERKLYNLTNAVRTIKKLFEISLSNNDYNFIISKKRYFDRALLSEFIKKNYLKYKLPFEHEYDLDIIFDNMEEAIQFYNIVQQRNNAMISNTIQVMRQNGEEVAALITGGFHSKSLASLMKEKGLSYLIIMPKFNEGDQRPYLAVLTNKRQPYEELLEAGEYILAVRAYFYTGNEQELRESIFYSLGRAYDEGMSLEPLMEKWLRLFTYDYYAFSEVVRTWTGEGKRPITPDELAKLFGLELNVTLTEDRQVKSLNITKEPGKEAGFYAESVQIGGDDIIVVRNVQDDRTQIEVALMKDEDGRYAINLVPPQAKRVLRRRSKEVRKEIGKKIAVEISKERISELLDQENAAAKAQREEIKRLVTERIRTRYEKYKIEDINIEGIIARTIRSKGYRLPKDWHNNEVFKGGIETLANDIRGELKEAVRRQEFIKLRKTKKEPEVVEHGQLNDIQRDNLRKGLQRLQEDLPDIGRDLKESDISLWQNMRELAAFRMDGIDLDIVTLGNPLATTLSIYHERLHDILRGQRGRETIPSREEEYYEKIFVVSKVLEYLYSDKVTEKERQEYLAFLENTPSINNAQFKHMTSEYERLEDKSPERVALLVAKFAKRAYARDWGDTLKGSQFDLRRNAVKKNVISEFERINKVYDKEATVEPASRGEKQPKDIISHQIRLQRTYSAKSILNPLELKPTDTYLDLAGGPGTYTAAAVVKGIRKVIWLDISERNLPLVTGLLKNINNLTDKEKRRILQGTLVNIMFLLTDIRSRATEEGKIPENVDIIQGDARELPFESDTIDKVSVTDLLVWLGSEEKQNIALREMLRVTKEGGLIHITQATMKLEELRKRFINVADKLRVKLEFEETQPDEHSKGLLIKIISKGSTAFELTRLETERIYKYLDEYLKIEGKGNARSDDPKRDEAIVEEIRKMGRGCIQILKSILREEEKVWIRAKAALVLGKLYSRELKGVLALLFERMSEDESVLVRSIIARQVLPEIKKQSSETEAIEIERRIETANLDPWAKKEALQVLDVGCQFGEASHGMARYYRDKGFDVVVVGVDKRYPCLIEAEKNRSDPDVVFVFGNVDTDTLGPADIVISQNLLVYRNEIRKHAESLIRQVRPDGGTIYFAPSVWNTYYDSSGEGGIMRLWDMQRYLKELLPEVDVQVSESLKQRTDPFGFDYIKGAFGSPWGASYGWIKASLPSRITIDTEKGLVRLRRGRFPDGELYLRILNPDMVKDAKVTVSCGIDSADDIVEIVLLMEILRMYGAENIQLVLDKPYDITNGLDKVLRYLCDGMAYRVGREIREFDTVPLKAIKEKKPSVWVDRVLYRLPRFETDIEEAAASINAKCDRVEIVMDGDNPLNWTVSLPEGLRNENVVLVNNTQISEDIVKLWLMLIALRRAGVASISLVNTYEGYSRQDKVFKAGEGISVVTMLKVADALVDNHMALNLHYGNESGILELAGYRLYNLNAFIQVAENLFDVVAEWVGKDNLVEELKAHPILLVAPDDGAFGYVREVVDVLKKYIKRSYGIDTDVHCGYMHKERISPTEVRMEGRILGEDGQPLSSVANVSECWAFILDDETSHGTTLLMATYLLVKELGLPWQRVLTGVVHGKLARGLEPFETGRGKEEIKTALEPKSRYIDYARKLMPPRLFVCTRSILPREFPERTVSIGPIVTYAVKRIIGDSSQGISSDKTEGRKPIETKGYQPLGPRYELGDKEITKQTKYRVVTKRTLRILEGELAGREFTIRHNDMSFEGVFSNEIFIYSNPRCEDRDLIAEVTCEFKPGQIVNLVAIVISNEEYLGKGLSYILINLAFEDLVAKGATNFRAFRVMMLRPNVGVVKSLQRYGFSPDPDVLDDVLSRLTPEKVLGIEISHEKGEPIAYRIWFKEGGPDWIWVILRYAEGNPVMDLNEYKGLIGELEECLGSNVKPEYLDGIGERIGSGNAWVGNVDYVVKDEDMEIFWSRIRKPELPEDTLSTSAVDQLKNLIGQINEKYLENPDKIKIRELKVLRRFIEELSRDELLEVDGASQISGLLKRLRTVSRLEKSATGLEKLFNEKTGLDSFDIRGQLGYGDGAAEIPQEPGRPEIEKLPEIKNVSGRVDKRTLEILHDLALMNNVVLHFVDRNEVMGGEAFEVNERKSKGGLTFTTIRIAYDLTAGEYTKLTKEINPELKGRPIEEILAEEGLRSLEQLERATSEELGIDMQEVMKEVKEKLEGVRENPDVEARSAIEAEALSILQGALQKLPYVEYGGSILREHESPRRVLHQLSAVCSEKTEVALSLLNSMLSDMKYDGVHIYGASVLENYIGWGESHVCIIARLSNGQAHILDADQPKASGRVPKEELELPEDIRDGYEVEIKQEISKEGESRFHRKLQLMHPVTYMQVLVYNNLGPVYLRQDMLKEAEECFKTAVKITRFADAHFNLGMVYLRQGMLKEAEECFKKAIEIKPRDAEANYNLGRVCKQQDKLKEAREHFQRFLDLPGSYRYPKLREYAESFLINNFIETPNEKIIKPKQITKPLKPNDEKVRDEIRKNPGSTQREIARKVSLPEWKVSGIIGKLERMGLVVVVRLGKENRVRLKGEVPEHALTRTQEEFLDKIEEKSGLTPSEIRGGIPKRTASRVIGELKNKGLVETRRVGKETGGSEIMVYLKGKVPKILLTSNEEKVRDEIRKNPGSTISKIAGRVSLPSRTVSGIIGELKNKGLVETRRVGKETGGSETKVYLKGKVPKILLTSNEEKVLTAVIEEPDLTQRRIAERVSLSSSTVGTIVDKLKSKGLVETRRVGKENQVRSIIDEGIQGIMEHIRELADPKVFKTLEAREIKINELREQYLPIIQERSKKEPEFVRQLGIAVRILLRDEKIKECADVVSFIQEFVSIDLCRPRNGETKIAAILKAQKEGKEVYLHSVFKDREIDEEFLKEVRKHPEKFYVEVNDDGSVDIMPPLTGNANVANLSKHLEQLWEKRNDFTQITVGELERLENLLEALSRDDVIRVQGRVRALLGVLIGDYSQLPSGYSEIAELVKVDLQGEVKDKAKEVLGKLDGILGQDFLSGRGQLDDDERRAEHKSEIENPLSDAEMYVLECIAKDMSYKEIEAARGWKEGTASAHVKNARKKLDPKGEIESKDPKFRFRVALLAAQKGQIKISEAEEKYLKTEIENPLSGAEMYVLECIAKDMSYEEIELTVTWRSPARFMVEGARKKIRKKLIELGCEKEKVNSFLRGRHGIALMAALLKWIEISEAEEEYLKTEMGEKVSLFVGVLTRAAEAYSKANMPGKVAGMCRFAAEICSDRGDYERAVELYGIASGAYIEAGMPKDARKCQDEIGKIQGRGRDTGPSEEGRIPDSGPGHADQDLEGAFRAYGFTAEENAIELLQGLVRDGIMTPGEISKELGVIKEDQHDKTRITKSDATWIAKIYGLRGGIIAKLVKITGLSESDVRAVVDPLQREKLVNLDERLSSLLEGSIKVLVESRGIDRTVKILSSLDDVSLDFFRNTIDVASEFESSALRTLDDKRFADVVYYAENAGKGYFLIGMFDKAIEMFDLAIGNCEDDPTRLVNLYALKGEACFRAGKYKEAGDALKNAVEICRDALNLRSRADGLSKDADNAYLKAVDLLEKEGEEDLKAAEIWRDEVGDSDIAKGLFEKAGDAFRNAAEICRDELRDNNKVAEFSEKAGDAYRDAEDKDNAIPSYTMAFRAFKILKDETGAKRCEGKIRNILRQSAAKDFLDPEGGGNFNRKFIGSDGEIIAATVLRKEGPFRWRVKLADERDAVITTEDNEKTVESIEYIDDERRTEHKPRVENPLAAMKRSLTDLDEAKKVEAEEIEIKGLKIASGAGLTLTAAFTAGSLLTSGVAVPLALGIIGGISLSYSIMQGITAYFINKAFKKAGIETRAGPIVETRTRPDGTKYIWTHPVAFNYLPRIIQKLVLLHERTHLAGYGEFMAYMFPWIGSTKIVKPSKRLTAIFDYLKWLRNNREWRPSVLEWSAISKFLNSLEETTRPRLAVDLMPKVNKDSLSDIIGSQKMDEIEKTVLEINKLFSKEKPRIVFINATETGGGVAGLRHDTTGLLKELGEEAQWAVIDGNGVFYSVTVHIHEGLHDSNYVPLHDLQRILYQIANIYNFHRLEKEGYFDADVLWLDDAQIAAMIPLIRALHPEIKIVWRLHIDTSEPQQEIADYISDMVSGKLDPKRDKFLYDYLVYHKGDEFVNEGIANGHFGAHVAVVHKEEFAKGLNFEEKDIPVYVMGFAINPLSYKNVRLSLKSCRQTFKKYGLNPNAPTVVEVSRFDPFKGPLEAIESFVSAVEQSQEEAHKMERTGMQEFEEYLKVKEFAEKAQFVYAGNQAGDNYNKCKRIVQMMRNYREQLPDEIKSRIFILELEDGTGKIEFTPEQKESFISDFEELGRRKDTQKIREDKLTGVEINALEINSLQTGCGKNIVIQMSSKEGYGIIVSEALWKALWGKSVVLATLVGGISEQITDENGVPIGYSKEDIRTSHLMYRNLGIIADKIEEIKGRLKGVAKGRIVAEEEILKYTKINYQNIRTELQNRKVVRDMSDAIYKAWMMSEAEKRELAEKAHEHVLNNSLVTANVKNILLAIQLAAMKRSLTDLDEAKKVEAEEIEIKGLKIASGAGLTLTAAFTAGSLLTSGVFEAEEIEIKGLKIASGAGLTLTAAFTAGSLLTSGVAVPLALGIIGGISLSYSIMQGITAYFINKEFKKRGIETRASPIADTKTLPDGTKYIWTAPEFANLPTFIQKLVLLHERTHLVGYGEFMAYAFPFLGLLLSEYKHLIVPEEKKVEALTEEEEDWIKRKLSDKLGLRVISLKAASLLERNGVDLTDINPSLFALHIMSGLNTLQYRATNDNREILRCLLGDKVTSLFRKWVGETGIKLKIQSPLGQRGDPWVDVLKNGESLGVGQEKFYALLDLVEKTNGLFTKENNGTVSIGCYSRNNIFQGLTDSVYMNKIVSTVEGCNFDPGHPLKRNILRWSMASGKPKEECKILLLNRNRHEKLIEEAIEAGIKVEEKDILKMREAARNAPDGIYRNGNLILVDDGDLLPILNMLLSENEKDKIDIICGAGGIIEAAILAAFVKLYGGSFAGQIVARRVLEEELDKGLDSAELVKSNIKRDADLFTIEEREALAEVGIGDKEGQISIDTIFDENSLIKEKPDAIVITFIKDFPWLKGLPIKGIDIDRDGNANVNCLYCDNTGIKYFNLTLKTEIATLRDEIKKLEAQKMQESREWANAMLKLTRAYLNYQFYNEAKECLAKAESAVGKRLKDYPEEKEELEALERAITEENLLIDMQMSLCESGRETAIEVAEYNSALLQSETGRRIGEKIYSLLGDKEYKKRNFKGAEDYYLKALERNKDNETIKRYVKRCADLNRADDLIKLLGMGLEDSIDELIELYIKSDDSDVRVYVLELLISNVAVANEGLKTKIFEALKNISGDERPQIRLQFLEDISYLAARLKEEAEISFISELIILRLDDADESVYLKATALSIALIEIPMVISNMFTHHLLNAITGYGGFMNRLLKIISQKEDASEELKKAIETAINDNLKFEESIKKIVNEFKYIWGLKPFYTQSIENMLLITDRIIWKELQNIVVLMESVTQAVDALNAKKGEFSKTAQSYITIVTTQFGHFTKAIADISDALSYPAIEEKACCINELAHKAVKNNADFAQDKGIPVKIETWHEESREDKKCFVHADPRQIEYVLTELIRNAIQANILKFEKAKKEAAQTKSKSPKSSEFEVTVKISGTPDSDRVFISVIDKGIGIKLRKFPEIFLPLPPGDIEIAESVYSGTSIAMIYKIVRAHGFNLKITQQRNIGSVFTFPLRKLVPTYSYSRYGKAVKVDVSDLDELIGLLDKMGAAVHENEILSEYKLIKCASEMLPVSIEKADFENRDAYLALRERLLNGAELLKNVIGESDIPKVCYEIARKHYNGKTFESGESILAHTFKVAATAKQWGEITGIENIDLMVAAALLHKISIDDLRKELRQSSAISKKEYIQIIEFIRGLSEINALAYLPPPSGLYIIQNQMNKIIKKIGGNPALMLLVFADKFQTISTTQRDSSEREYVSREILDIYDPLASRLGLENLAQEFKDEIFRLSYPEEYERIKKEVEEVLGMEHEDAYQFLSDRKREFIAEMKKVGLDVSRIKISTRVKSLYKIWVKIGTEETRIRSAFSKEKIYREVRDVEDLFGFQVVCKTEEELWTSATAAPQIAPSVIQDQTKPMRRLTDDGVIRYEAFHLGARDSEGRPYEFKFMTEANFEKAIKGVGAHWIYDLKRQKFGQRFELDEKPLTGNFVIDFNNIYNAISRWDYIDVPVMEGKQIVALRPLRVMPQSTPLDIAANPEVNNIADYKGHNIFRVRYDLETASLIKSMPPTRARRKTLETGDVVEIITEENFLIKSKEPSRRESIFMKSISTRTRKHPRTRLLVKILGDANKRASLDERRKVLQDEVFLKSKAEEGREVLRETFFEKEEIQDLWEKIVYELGFAKGDELLAALATFDIKLKEIEEAAQRLVAKRLAFTAEFERLVSSYEEEDSTDVKIDTKARRVSEEKDTHPAIKKAINDGRFYIVDNILDIDIEELFSGQPEKIITRFEPFIEGFTDTIRNKMLEKLRSPPNHERLKRGFILIQEIVKELQKKDTTIARRKFAIILEDDKKPAIFFTHDKQGKPIGVLAHSGVRRKSIYLGALSLEHALDSKKARSQLTQIISHENDDIKAGKHVRLTVEQRKTFHDFFEGLIGKAMQSSANAVDSIEFFKLAPHISLEFEKEGIQQVSNMGKLFILLGGVIANLISSLIFFAMGYFLIFNPYFQLPIDISIILMFIFNYCCNINFIAAFANLIPIKMKTSYFDHTVLQVINTLAFILFFPAVITHELGHYLAAKSLGLDARISFKGEELIRVNKGYSTTDGWHIAVLFKSTFINFIRQNKYVQLAILAKKLIFRKDISITIGVVGVPEDIVNNVNRKIVGIKLVVLNKATERENLEILEEARKIYHAYASGIIETDIKDERELRNIVEELASAIEQEDRRLFALANPEIVKLNPQTIKDISNIGEALKRIVERIPSIRSMRTSELSVYNMRITNIAQTLAFPSLTPKTQDYLRDNKEDHIISIAADTLGEVKMLAEAHRERMNLAKRLNPEAAPLTLQVRLTVKEEDRSKINNNTKQELLRLMEIDDVLNVDNLILIDESQKGALSTKDIYDRFIDHSEYKKENIAIVDSIKEERSPDEIPEGIVFMEYEGIATSQVYDATLELLAHKPHDPNIPGLERHKQWFRFLPRIEPADMERIREEMDQYKKVLMAA